MPTENDSSTSSVQLGEGSNQAGGPVVDQVFSLFKDYLQNQLETKTKEIEQKSKIDKEVVRLKYRGNQKQFELNAAIDSFILESIESETQQSQPSSDNIQSLAQDARELLRKRQKLIKIADKLEMVGRSSPNTSPMSWLQDQKTKSASKKLVRLLVVNADRKTRQTMSAGKRRGLVKVVIISFFAVGHSMTSFYFVNSHNLDPLAYPTISFVCLIITGIEG